MPASATDSIAACLTDHCSAGREASHQNSSLIASSGLMARIGDLR